VFSFLSNNMGSKGHEATDALDALSIAMMEEFDAAGAGLLREGAVNRASENERTSHHRIRKFASA